jgi:hypothetical protein
MSLLKVNTVETSLVQKTGGTGSPAIREMPAFRAYADTDQSITSGVVTKVSINNKTGDNFFDTNSWFNTTNYRYTPQIAGYYFFTGLVRAAGTNMTDQIAYFYKNNIEYSIGQINRVSTSTVMNITVSDIIYLNGSSDYVELYGYIAGTSPSFDYTRIQATSLFSGFLVRPD